MRVSFSPLYLTFCHLTHCTSKFCYLNLLYLAFFLFTWVIGFNFVNIFPHHISCGKIYGIGSQENAWGVILSHCQRNKWNSFIIFIENKLYLVTSQSSLLYDLSSPFLDKLHLYLSIILNLFTRKLVPRLSKFTCPLYTHLASNKRDGK